MKATHKTQHNWDVIGSQAKLLTHPQRGCRDAIAWENITDIRPLIPHYTCEGHNITERHRKFEELLGNMFNCEPPK